MTSSAHSAFKIGYARVSTNTQDEALQIDALQRAAVDRVFVDRASGSAQDRPGLRFGPGPSWSPECAGVRQTR